nr:MAG TPA: hypothetical protein [Caudoviricetes sp.]DAZ54879.1 MAG TPA: hypothetical protein [Caudoviricetes sp.]
MRHPIINRFPCYPQRIREVCYRHAFSATFSIDIWIRHQIHPL